MHLLVNCLHRVDQQSHAQRRQASSTLILLLLAIVLNSEPIAGQQDAWRSQKYILPVLRAGPNNQVRHHGGMTKHYTDRGKRYSLPKKHSPPPAATSLVSNQTLATIQPAGAQGHMAGYSSSIGWAKSPPKCFKEEVPYHIEFSEILDRQYVEEFTRVTTADEMRAAGWDGVIDAFVYPNATFKLEKVIPYLHMTASAAKVHMYHDLAVVTTRNNLKCKRDAIQELKRKINQWRVVAMMFIVIGNNEVVSLTTEGIDPPAEPCWSDLWHANRRLKASAWLQGIARQYVLRHVGAGPYLAMHVRPQADPCWKLWMNRNFDPVALSKKGVCWAGHALLHTVVGPKALATMQKYQLNQLVVLTHPNLQPVINEMLEKVNLTAKYIVPSYVSEIAGCQDRSSTFLMLVEMQVAVQSTVFLGTASSSITETVLYERLAVGNTLNTFLDRPYPQAPPPPAAPPAPDTPPAPGQPPQAAATAGVIQGDHQGVAVDDDDIQQQQQLQQQQQQQHLEQQQQQQLQQDVGGLAGQQVVQGNGNQMPLNGGETQTMAGGTHVTI